MKESEWTRKICNEMTRCNAKIFCIVGSMLQEPGWPDRIVWHAWWHGFLEFKGVNTKLEVKQRIIIRELNERVPGSAFVIRQPDLIEDFGHFDGTGRGLLNALSTILQDVRRSRAR